MSPEEQKRRHKTAKGVGEGSIVAVEQFMADRVKPVLKGADKPTRYILKTVPKAGGAVYTGAQILTAEDKPRAVVGAIGGAIGGWGGAALGGMTGPAAVVASPALAAVGSVKDQELAEDLYDDHHEAVRRKMEDTKRWMKERQAEVYANASQMMAPYWQVDDLNRARRR